MSAAQAAAELQSSLPLYHQAIDWNWLYSEYPVPDVYARTVYRWPAERVCELQNRRFLALIRRRAFPRLAECSTRWSSHRRS